MVRHGVGGLRLGSMSATIRISMSEDEVRLLLDVLHLEMTRRPTALLDGTLPRALRKLHDALRAGGAIPA